jgi:hypothetical protein
MHMQVLACTDTIIMKLWQDRHTLEDNTCKPAINITKRCIASHRMVTKMLATLIKSDHGAHCNLGVCHQCMAQYFRSSFSDHGTQYVLGTLVWMYYVYLYNTSVLWYPSTNTQAAGALSMQYLVSCVHNSKYYGRRPFQGNVRNSSARKRRVEFQFYSFSHIGFIQQVS